MTFFAFNTIDTPARDSSADHMIIFKGQSMKVTVMTIRSDFDLFFDNNTMVGLFCY